MPNHTHAAGSEPSPEIVSELKTLQMAVEAQHGGSPEGLQALGKVKAALEAAEAGNTDEARSIVAEAWAWVRDHLTLTSVVDNVTDLGESLADGAANLGESIAHRWSTLFGADDAADDASTASTSAAPEKRA